MSITKEGIQWCSHCKDYTNHIPKMDAVKNGQRVCDECRCCNNYDVRDNRCDECGGWLRHDKLCDNCHD